MRDSGGEGVTFVYAGELEKCKIATKPTVHRVLFYVAVSKIIPCLPQQATIALQEMAVLKAYTIQKWSSWFLKIVIANFLFLFSFDLSHCYS